MENLSSIICSVADKNDIESSEDEDDGHVPLSVHNDVIRVNEVANDTFKSTQKPKITS